MYGYSGSESTGRGEMTKAYQLEWVGLVRVVTTQVSTGKERYDDPVDPSQLIEGTYQTQCK